MAIKTEESRTREASGRSSGQAMETEQKRRRRQGGGLRGNGKRGRYEVGTVF